MNPLDVAYRAWLEQQVAAAPEPTAAQLALIGDVERGLARDTA